MIPQHVETVSTRPWLSERWWELSRFAKVPYQAAGKNGRRHCCSRVDLERSGSPKLCTTATLVGKGPMKSGSAASDLCAVALCCISSARASALFDADDLRPTLLTPVQPWPWMPPTCSWHRDRYLV